MSESSVDQSRPVEVYRFEITGYDPMLFTSDEVAVTCEGDTYAPLPGLSRSALIIAPFGEDSADFTVTVPATSLLATRCGLLRTPRSVRLIWRRYQRTDLDTAVMRREGNMAGATISGGACSLVFPSPFEAGLAPVIPKTKIQTQCNWSLGDSNCGKDLTSMWSTVTDIAEVVRFSRPVNGQYTLRADWAEGADPFSVLLWKGGIITGVNGDATESRTLYKTEALGSRTGPVMRITLSRSFEIPLAGTVFTIRQGCDNSFARCAMLQNTARFGGFPFVPTEHGSPFQIRFDKKRKPA